MHTNLCRTTSTEICNSRRNCVEKWRCWSLSNASSNRHRTLEFRKKMAHKVPLQQWIFLYFSTLWLFWILVAYGGAGEQRDNTTRADNLVNRRDGFVYEGGKNKSINLSSIPRLMLMKPRVLWRLKRIAWLQLHYAAVYTHTQTHTHRRSIGSRGMPRRLRRKSWFLSGFYSRFFFVYI